MEKDEQSETCTEIGHAGSCQYAQDEAGTCADGGTPLTQECSALVQGYTYFVSDGELIKIGHSSRPRARIKSIEYELSKSVETLAIVPADIAGEFETHQRFAHLRIRGEWFQPADDLLNFIDDIKVEDRRPWQKVSPETAALLSNLHGLRIESSGNEPVLQRASILVGCLMTLDMPEGYPGHHRAVRANMKRATDELAVLPMKGGAI